MDISLKSVPFIWLGPEEYFGDGECHCGYHGWDPDCDMMPLAVNCPAEAPACQIIDSRGAICVPLPDQPTPAQDPESLVSSGYKIATIILGVLLGLAVIGIVVLIIFRVF